MVSLKFTEDYFSSLNEKANTISKCLYYTDINDNLKNAIIEYLDTYFEAFKEYTNLNQKDENLTRVFSILQKPINEASNPYNINLSDGNKHPAVDLINEKLKEFYKDLESENSNSLEKGFSRSLVPNNMKGINLDNDDINNLGFTRSFIIIIFTIVLGVILGIYLFSLK